MYIYVRVRICTFESVFGCTCECGYVPRSTFVFIYLCIRTFTSHSGTVSQTLPESQPYDQCINEHLAASGLLGICT